MEDFTEAPSLIQRFYKGKSILLTGATGFVGKATLEKLLRVCCPAQVFLLIRPKKGKSIEERIQELFTDPVFERLLKEVPGYSKKICGIEGDISKPSLALSEECRRTLIDKIEIVLHGAATVRFDEDLRNAVEINVQGTKEIIDLCKEMKNLQAVTHVSTAYAYCNLRELEEKFYESPIKADTLITLVRSLDQDQLTAVTPVLLGDWPNTYSFTKAVAEEVIQSSGLEIPIAVFRPSIVIGAKEEPFKGWIDNLYGPTGVLVGAGTGVMRVLWADSRCVADLVPVDMTVNALLSVTYETTLRRPNSPVKIYNFVSSNQKVLTWGDFHTNCINAGRICPSVKSIYYYTFTLTSNRKLFAFYSLLFHLIPAFFIDIFLVILRKKLRMMKVYSKVAKFSNVIGYFANRSWKFHNNNIQQLLSNLEQRDRELFDFDFTNLDWKEFFIHNTLAIRKYILKDPDETLPQGKRKFFWLHVLHRVVQILSFLLFLWIVKSLYHLFVFISNFYSNVLPSPVDYVHEIYCK